MKTKLTAEQINFIDSYLLNSGVRYIDIRFEMTDHVATALEEMDGDFYENFKKYMVLNKSGLLASNRRFKKLATAKAWRVMKTNFLSIPFWILALGIFSASFLLQGYLGKDQVSDNIHMTLVLLSTPLYFYFLYYNVIRKEKNSVIDKLLTILYFGAFIFRLDRLVEGNNTLLLVYFSLSISFMLLLMRSLWQLNNQFKAVKNV
jgi:hypothetical protein